MPMGRGAKVQGAWEKLEGARVITARKEIERALRESEEHFWLLTEGVRDWRTTLRALGPKPASEVVP
jgi:hypothetical protein